MDALLAVKGDVWNPPAVAVEDCNREVDEALRYDTHTRLR